MLVSVKYVNKIISYSPCRWMLVGISFFPKGISNNWGRHRNMKFCLYNNLCVIVRACIYFRLLWFTRNVFKKDCWKHNQIYLDVKFTSWLCTSSTQTLFLNKLIFQICFPNKTKKEEICFLFQFVCVSQNKIMNSSSHIFSLNIANHLINCRFDGIYIEISTTCIK